MDIFLVKNEDVLCTYTNIFLFRNLFSFASMTSFRLLLVEVFQSSFFFGSKDGLDGMLKIASCELKQSFVLWLNRLSNLMDLNEIHGQE